MRAILLNRFYWPDEVATAQLLTDLAEGLASSGDDVLIITSHPGSTQVPAEETRRGVRILRVRSTRWAGRFGLGGKVVDFFSFFVAMLWRLLRQARRGDVIVALTDPPLLGVGAWIVAGLRGARLIHWVQDIYPEVAVELGAPRLLNLLRPIRDAAWQAADRCVTLGEDMARVATAAGVAAEAVSILPNWAPAGLTPPPASIADELRAEWGLTGKFVVAYSGNLGRVHDLEPLLSVAAALRDQPSIAFVIVGHGAQATMLKALAAKLALPNLQFRPPQPRTRLQATLALGDVHVVTLRPGCEHYVYPSKLIGVAAIGRPVLFIGPTSCEIARLVEAADGGLGRAFDRASISAAAQALRRLAADPALCERLSAAALRFARRNGDARAAANQWHTWLAEGARS